MNSTEHIRCSSGSIVDDSNGVADDARKAKLESDLLLQVPNALDGSIRVERVIDPLLESLHFLLKSFLGFLEGLHSGQRVDVSVDAFLESLERPTSLGKTVPPLALDLCTQVRELIVLDSDVSKWRELVK